MASASSRPLVGILLVWSAIALAFGLDLALADRFPPTGDDILHHYYPGYEATYRRIADGELPLWNPHLLCGSPWLASLQLGVLYPPHVVYLLLPLRAAFGLSAFLVSGCPLQHRNDLIGSLRHDAPTFHRAQAVADPFAGSVAARRRRCDVEQGKGT